MSDDTGRFDLSRRKLLGSAATIGAAGALGGAGSVAFLYDEESYANNELTAGSLDLKVDWEEHYSDWSDDEAQDIAESDTDGPGDDGTGAFTIEMEEPDNTDAFTPFPPGTSAADDTPEPLIWVPNAFVDDFMTNTALEAYPDDDNDGTGEFPVEDLLPNREPCDVLADVGDLEKSLTTYTTAGDDVLARTDNEDTRLDNGDPAPLINLTDVKPGDFGEVTFSTHLCDNPGYLWINMPGGLRASENGVTDPEGEDEDEQDNVVELVDEVQTALWYDNNCDNLVTGEEKLDVLLVLDTSESIEGDLREDTDPSTPRVNDDTQEIDRLADGVDRLLDRLPTDRVDGQPRVRAGLMTYNGPIEGDAGGLPRVETGPTLRESLGPPDQFDLDGDGSAETEEFLPVVGTGGSPLPHALDIAEQILLDQGRSDARQVIVLVTDALPDYSGPSSPTTPYSTDDEPPGDTGGTVYTQQGSYVGDNDGLSTCTELDESARAANTAKANGVDILGTGIGIGTTDCDPDGDGTPIDGDTFLTNRIVGVRDSGGTAEPNYFFDPEDFSNIEAVADAIVQQLTGGGGNGDEVFFRGTLRELEAELTSGNGIPLDGDRGTAFDELNDPDDSDAREPFLAFNTACFGFSWWLPLNHGDEVQSDSVQFDIGFRAEQARHNDGGVGNA